MKRFSWLLTILLGLLLMPNLSYAGVSVYVDGQQLKFDQQPYVDMEAKRTLVPFRQIFESLGANVWFDEANNSAMGQKGDLTIQLPINESRAVVNGKNVGLDVESKIVNGRTMVPLRFVSENLGSNVTTEGDLSNLAIYINKEKGNYNTYSLSTAEDIENYLNKEYSHLSTELADIDFDIRVTENDNKNIAYDYHINFFYNYFHFERIFNSHTNSIKHAETAQQDVELSRKQIKNHIEKAAKDIISKLPDKKFLGNTRDDWYRWEYIQEGRTSSIENSWVNYQPKKPIKNSDLDGYFRASFNMLKYNEVQLDEFKWMPELDKFYYNDPLS